MHDEIRPIFPVFQTRASSAGKTILSAFQALKGAVPATKNRLSFHPMKHGAIMAALAVWRMQGRVIFHSARSAVLLSPPADMMNRHTVQGVRGYAGWQAALPCQHSIAFL
ncbi:MAG TPA: hypothetical protein VFI23_13965 [Rhizomicrobium sp.]|nr:hypothetical protein [Rhizomicrobium sp.]